MLHQLNISINILRKSTLFWSFLMNVSFKAWYKPGTTTLGKILCRAWCAKSILDSRRAGDDDAISQTLNWIVREEGIFVAFNHRSCLSLFYTCCFFESLVPISHPFKVCFFEIKLPIIGWSKNLQKLPVDINGAVFGEFLDHFIIRSTYF